MQNFQVLFVHYKYQLPGQWFNESRSYYVEGTLVSRPSEVKDTFRKVKGQSVFRIIMTDNFILSGKRTVGLKKKCFPQAVNKSGSLSSKMILLILKVSDRLKHLRIRVSTCLVDILLANECVIYVDL